MPGLSDFLADPPPPSVHLARTPLIRVIAQVRFPPVLALAEQKTVAAFQEAIRREYPVLRIDQVHGIDLGPTGAVPAAPKVAWRFASAKGTWVTTLTTEFLALETVSYSGRDDFFARLVRLLEALEAHVAPAIVDRFGLRAIDRLDGDAFTRLAELVRPEVLGVLRSALMPSLEHAYAEHLFRIGDDRLLARWGVLPAGATADPAAIPPIDRPSWILDLDMSTTQTFEFSPAAVEACARRFSDRIYATFRALVTDAFLEHFGGGAVAEHHSRAEAEGGDR